MSLNNKTKTQVYIDLWLETKQNYRSYKYIAKRVAYFKKKFGNRDISSISQVEMKNWALDLAKTRKSNTVKSFLSAIKQIFEFAVEDRVIENNPIYRIYLPKDVKREANPFSKKEVKKILEKVDKKDWLYAYLNIAFNTGLRCGEILGLQWNDLDLDNLTISITRNVSNGKERPLKTKHSYRTIPLNKAIIPALEMLKNRNNSSRWLFCNRNGGHMHSSTNCKARWRKLLKECCITYRRLYETRHTFASHMILENSVPLIFVSKILGHSDLQTTLCIYAKQIEGEHLKISRDIELY